jgi:hypothetical protein
MSAKGRLGNPAVDQDALPFQVGNHENPCIHGDLIT